MMPVYADAASSATFYVSRNTNIQSIYGVSNAVGNNAIAMDIEKYYYYSTYNYHIFHFKIGLQGILDDVLGISFNQEIENHYRCQHAIYSMAIGIQSTGFIFPTTSGSVIDSIQDNNENFEVLTGQPSSQWTNLVTVCSILTTLLGAATGLPVALFTVPVAATSIMLSLTDGQWGSIFDFYAETRYNYWSAMMNMYGSGPSLVPTIGVERSYMGMFLEWKVPKTPGTYQITVTGQLGYGYWQWIQPSPPNPQYYWNIFLSGYVECSVTIKCIVS